MGFMAAHTSKIALGTASIVLPLRNPLHTAKAAVDQLSNGRLLLGVASGDRPVEFPAFNIDPEKRGEIFRERVEVIRRLQRTSFEHVSWSDGELIGADLVPKPTTNEIPLFVTGHSRQSLDWIAKHGCGWITRGLPSGKHFMANVEVICVLAKRTGLLEAQSLRLRTSVFRK